MGEGGERGEREKEKWMDERAREDEPLAGVKPVSARSGTGVTRFPRRRIAPTPTPTFHSSERTQSINQTRRFNAIAIH